MKRFTVVKTTVMARCDITVKYISMKQNREHKNKPIHMWSIDFFDRCDQVIK